MKTRSIKKSKKNSNSKVIAVSLFLAALVSVAGSFLAFTPVVKADPITLVSTVSPDPITVSFGTPIANVPLPVTLSAVMSDGSTPDLVVSWNTKFYNANLAGNYPIVGTVTLPDNSIVTATVLFVTVLPQPNITSVSFLSNINVANGTALSSIGLPATVGIVLHDGSSASTAVAWDGGMPAYDGNTSGTYKFAGTLTVPSGDTNIGNLSASVNVIVAAPVITTPTSTPSSTPVLSSDDALSAFNVNGTGVAGFSSTTLNYNVTLAAGTTVVPTVTAIADDVNATAVVTAASGLPGTSTILVTAQNGTTNQTYAINFTVAAPVVVTPTSTISSTPTSTATSTGSDSTSGDSGSVINVPSNGGGVSVGVGSGYAVGSAPGGGSGSGGGGVPVPQGVVLGASTTATTTLVTAPNASTTCGIYLDNYLGFGKHNNSGDVRKLQSFLAENLGINLPVTGSFGRATLAAVKQFQWKYALDILAPWFPGTTPTNADATGYAYKLTTWKINMLVCPSLNLPAPTVS